VLRHKLWTQNLLSAKGRLAGEKVGIKNIALWGNKLKEKLQPFCLEEKK
jgi:hypothetical protein